MPGIEAGVSVARPAPNTCVALAIASAMKPCTAATSISAMRCRPVSADSAATSSAACASNAAPSARSAAARPSTPSACHAGCAARTARAGRRDGVARIDRETVVLDAGQGVSGAHLRRWSASASTPVETRASQIFAATAGNRQRGRGSTLHNGCPRTRTGPTCRLPIPRPACANACPGSSARVVVLGALLAWRFAGRGEPVPQFQTAAVDRGDVDLPGQRLRQPLGGGHGRSGQPGVGPHPVAVRGLQLGGQEGPADREDRSGAVRGGGRAVGGERAGVRGQPRAAAGAGRGRGAPGAPLVAAVRQQADLGERPRQRGRERARRGGRGAAGRRASSRRRARRCARRRPTCATPTSSRRPTAS